MKISDVCRQYGFDENDLKAFLKEKKLLKETWTSYVIEDSNVDKAVRMYAEFKAQQEEEAAAERREAEKKKRAMAKMLITSGFSFDGYTITKYSGYISGDDAISVDRGLAVFGSDTGVKDKLLNSLVEIRRNALRELKEAAYELGCNAVIGVDFDYITLDPQTKDLLATGGISYQPYVFAVQAHQPNAFYPVEHTGHDSGLAIAQAGVQPAGSGVFLVGVHAEHGAAALSRIAFIEGDKGGAVAPPRPKRVYHEGVKHHNLIRLSVVKPAHLCVYRRQRLVRRPRRQKGLPARVRPARSGGWGKLPAASLL